MPELLCTIAALAMCCLGCAMLALSQRDHWTAAASLLPYPAPRALRMIRVAASLLLAAALASCIAGHGAGFGLVLWVLLLAAGGLAVAFVLAWRPSWCAPVAFLICDTV
jgi:hypothetical protein